MKQLDTSLSILRETILAMSGYDSTAYRIPVVANIKVSPIYESRICLCTVRPSPDVANIWLNLDDETDDYGQFYTHINGEWIAVSSITEIQLALPVPAVIVTGSGMPGDPGDPGDRGSTGDRGDRGDKGDQGPRGPTYIPYKAITDKVIKFFQSRIEIRSDLENNTVPRDASYPFSVNLQVVALSEEETEVMVGCTTSSPGCTLVKNVLTIKERSETPIVVRCAVRSPFFSRLLSADLTIRMEQ